MLPPAGLFIPEQEWSCARWSHELVWAKRPGMDTWNTLHHSIKPLIMAGFPSTGAPTSIPSVFPMSSPSDIPTASPTLAPTSSPASSPTSSPASAQTGVPAASPTSHPTSENPAENTTIMERMHANYQKLVDSRRWSSSMAHTQHRISFWMQGDDDGKQNLHDWLDQSHHNIFIGCLQFQFMHKSSWNLQNKKSDVDVVLFSSSNFPNHSFVTTQQMHCLDKLLLCFHILDLSNCLCSQCQWDWVIGC